MIWGIVYTLLMEQKRQDELLQQTVM